MILAVAEELFAEHGVQAVTTRQIATRVGISQPSLYAHFPSVQHIEEEVSARAFARLAARLDEARAEAPEAQLTALVAAYVSFGLTHPQAYRIAFMIEHPKAASETGVTDFFGADHPGPRAFSHVLRIVSAVRPDLTGEALDIRAQSLWATLHGLVSLLLARPHFPWADRERLVAAHSAAAVEMVLRRD
ncbi:TetR/AcrR family transcriptional regulator [Pseudoroseicyclus sp. H15]